MTDKNYGYGIVKFNYGGFWYRIGLGLVGLANSLVMLLSLGRLATWWEINFALWYTRLQKRKLDTNQHNDERA